MLNCVLLCKALKMQEMVVFQADGVGTEVAGELALERSEL